MKEYQETVEFVCLPDGQEFLKAAPIDLAAKRMALEDLQDALARLEAATEKPPDVAAAEKAIHGGAQGEDLKDLIREWRQSRTSQWQFLQERLRREELALRQMEEEIDLPGITTRKEVYGCVKLTRRQVKEAENAHTEVDQEKGRRTVDTDARDEELLRQVLQYRAVGETREPPEDPAEMDYQVAEVLIGRMWARNSLNAGLARFFR